MKLTKTKLKQIIKEEIDKILDEGFLDSLTNMFGKTSGSGSAILDKAIKASKFDDFEESEMSEEEDDDDDEWP